MKARSVLPRLFIMTLLAIGGLACKDRTCPAVAQPKGFSLSPLGFPVSYDRLDAFFLEIRDFQDSGVLWNGAWRDDATNGTDAGQVPDAAATVVRQGKTDCFQTAAVFGWRSGSTLYLRVPENNTNSWLNDDAKWRFREMLKAFVSVERPAVIFLGNENDFYYEQDLLDYDRWLEFYGNAYDDIKRISDDTLVGPVFNFEHLSGNGSLNGWTRPFWEALENHDFKKVDLVGLTVYPFFRYSTPGGIPADYLDPFVDRLTTLAVEAEKTTIPFAITETGWPAENLGDLTPLWVASEQEQTNYFPKLADMIEGKTVSFVNWLFLNAMADDGTSSENWKIFGSVSLRNSSGLKRQAYDVWWDTWH